MANNYHFPLIKLIKILKNWRKYLVEMTLEPKKYKDIYIWSCSAPFFTPVVDIFEMSSSNFLHKNWTIGWNVSFSEARVWSPFFTIIFIFLGSVASSSYVWNGGPKKCFCFGFIPIFYSNDLLSFCNLPRVGSPVFWFQMYYLIALPFFRFSNFRTLVYSINVVHM